VETERTDGDERGRERAARNGLERHDERQRALVLVGGLKYGIDVDAVLGQDPREVGEDPRPVAHDEPQVVRRNEFLGRRGQARRE
jgi:hypothetical protein